MQPKISQLKSIFKNKLAVYEELKEYVKPIKELAKDEGLAELKQEQEHIFLEEHLFGKNIGLLPFIDELIELNGLLLSYEKPAYLGTATMKNYDEMIERVNKEQNFLITYFRRTLNDIIFHKGYREYWSKSFATYQSLLNILKLDLSYFYHVLQTQEKITTHRIINLIQWEQFDMAISFVKNGASAKIFSEHKINFFQRLLEALKYGRLEEANGVLEKDGKNLLKEDELKLLTYVLNRFRSKKESEKQLEVPLEQLVEKLELEEKELELIEEVAKEAAPEVIPQIEEKAEEIEEIIELVEEVVPEIEKVPEIQKLRKSRLKRLRTKFKFAKRNVKKRLKKELKDKKQVLAHGLKVLKESTDLRRKVNNSLKARRLSQAINRLNKEDAELKILLKEIQIKKGEFPKLAGTLLLLQNRVNAMLLNIKSAITIIYYPQDIEEIAEKQKEILFFHDLWEQLVIDRNVLSFLNQLQVLTSQKRQEIDSAIKSLDKKAISRRKFLKLGLAAGAVVAAGGAAVLLTRKKSQIKPKEQLKEEVVRPQPEEPELKFEPATITEVNKTIYTEGSYKNAYYTVVIPHSTELNALDAGKAVAKGPITYVAGNSDRNLKIKTKEGIFQVDPNNAFCNPGIIECFKFLNGKNLTSFKKETQEYVINSIRKFTDEISRRVFVGKMVLALHQNTKGNFGIKSYKYDPEFLKEATDVFINQKENNDVFAFVNTKGWFEVLKAKGWNVVLQKNDPSLDEGSISYAATWKGLPYVNIEVDIGNFGKQVEMIGILNGLIEQYPQLATDVNFVPYYSHPVSKIGGINLLFIGSDMMFGRAKIGERGDALVLINTDTNEKLIRILTIPRDTYVSIYGKKTKINHALAYGGWQLQKKIVEEFLGVSIDKILFLDVDNLHNIFSFVRQNLATADIINDLRKKLGVVEGAKVTWGEVKYFVTNRKFADAAVGRAKNHARAIAAIIKTLIEYHNDPKKELIFEKDIVRRLLSLVKYTNLTPQDVDLLFKEWSTNQYRVEMYFIPGKPENIDQISYWIAEEIPGGDGYFSRVINYRKSKLT